jgi:hypothetical protein
MSGSGVLATTGSESSLEADCSYQWCTYALHAKAPFSYIASSPRLRFPQKEWEPWDEHVKMRKGRRTQAGQSDHEQPA